MNLDWVSESFPDLEDVTPLGEGGQKWVFSARHPDDGDVVLKIIKPTISLEEVQREVDAAVSISSERVPRVFGAGQVIGPTGACIWLREQRISGAALRSVVGRIRFGHAKLLRLGEHVLEALCDVESARLVHRDIKPDNIVEDTTGRFWLLDFGIARHLDLDSLTATEAQFGKQTLGYAPLEQLRNMKRDIDIRADLFALGVTLYEMATGAHPFRTGARDPLEVIRRIERTTPPLADVDGDKDRLVGAWISTLMQRRRDYRPRSAQEALQWCRELQGEV